MRPPYGHTFCLIRHGESTSCEDAGYSVIKTLGQPNDESLTQRGTSQAIQLGSFARREKWLPKGFFSSPVRCAMLTHMHSTLAMGVEMPVAILDGLRPLDWGPNFRGQPASTLQSYRQTGRYGADFDSAPPGAESVAAVRKRAMHALHHIIQHYPPGYYWIYSHESTIKALLSTAFTWTSFAQFEQFRLPPISMTQLCLADSALVVDFYNRLPLSPR